VSGAESSISLHKVSAHDQKRHTISTGAQRAAAAVVFILELEQFLQEMKIKAQIQRQAAAAHSLTCAARRE
jgi:hypothetical protein